MDYRLTILPLETHIGTDNIMFYRNYHIEKELICREGSTPHKPRNYVPELVVKVLQNSQTICKFLLNVKQMIGKYTSL